MNDRYPLLAYNFKVAIKGIDLIGSDPYVLIGFTEVSGLNITYQEITYRHGMSYNTGLHAIPGIKEPIHIFMRKGIFLSENRDEYYSYLHEWMSRGKERRHIDISLCDENGDSLFMWTAINARPISLEGPFFSAEESSPAIESIQLIATDLEIKDVSGLARHQKYFSANIHNASIQDLTSEKNDLKQKEESLAGEKKKNPPDEKEITKLENEIKAIKDKIQKITSNIKTIYNPSSM